MYVKNPVNLAFHTHIKPAEESNMNGEELSWTIWIRNKLKEANNELSISYKEEKEVSKPNETQKRTWLMLSTIKWPGARIHLS
jgi:hypothetical protein